MNNQTTNLLGESKSGRSNYLIRMSLFIFKLLDMKTTTAHRFSFTTCWDRVSCVQIAIKYNYGS